MNSATNRNEHLSYGKDPKPLIPPSLFSPRFSWPTKIAFALSVISEGTPEEVAFTISELEGIASQEGVAEVAVTVAEYLRKLEELGKIASEAGWESSGRKYHLLRN